MIPSRTRRVHDDFIPDIELVQDRARSAILHFCEQNGFAYTGRMKESRSLSEKLESGRYNRWSEIDDLFACSIIVPNLTYEDKVLEFLCGCFDTKAIAKRGTTKKAPDQFRFDATRFRGNLVAQGKRERIHSIIFEVQVRSAFEHAWSVATHDLTYKGQLADWRSLRLSAQIKAAVEQLDTLIVRFHEAASPIVEHDWQETRLRTKIHSLFHGAVQAGRIPPEHAPKDWGVL